MYMFLFLSFFFFKQKTAYEMRISDWSSDVCSSDLSSVSLHSFLGIAARMAVGMGLTSPFDSLLPRKTMGGFGISNAVLPICCQNGQKGLRWVGSADAQRRFGHSRVVDSATKTGEVGRAAWRERAVQYEKFTVGGGT